MPGHAGSDAPGALDHVMGRGIDGLIYLVTRKTGWIKNPTYLA